MKTSNYKTYIVPILFALLFISACGTTTGNGRITIESESFSTAGFIHSFSAFSTNVSDFKVCVKKIQLKNDLDEIQKLNGQDDDTINFAAGLVDLSSGNSSSWGAVDVPVNFTLKRVKIHLHKDQSLCGVDYSVKFNSFTTNQNVVIQYNLDPVIVLRENDTLNLNFAAVVSALRNAADAGSLNNNTLREKLEAQDGSARRK